VILAATGVVAFATIAPSRERPLEPPKTPIVETLAIRLDAAPAPKSYFREELFQRGDTLPAFIERLGIEGPQAAKLAKLRVLQQLRPGTHVSAEVSAEGEHTGKALGNAAHFAAAPRHARERRGQRRGRAARAQLPQRPRHADQDRRGG
jgi:hypothetical protein